MVPAVPGAIVAASRLQGVESAANRIVTDGVEVELEPFGIEGGDGFVEDVGVVL